MDYDKAMEVLSQHGYTDKEDISEIVYEINKMADMIIDILLSLTLDDNEL